MQLYLAALSGDCYFLNKKSQGSQQIVFLGGRERAAECGSDERPVIFCEPIVNFHSPLERHISTESAQISRKAKFRSIFGKPIFKKKYIILQKTIGGTFLGAFLAVLRAFLAFLRAFLAFLIFL